MIRVGVADLPPLLFAAGRSCIGGSVLLALALYRGDRLPRTARDWRLHVLLLNGADRVEQRPGHVRAQAPAVQRGARCSTPSLGALDRRARHAGAEGPAARRGPACSVCCSDSSASRCWSGRAACGSRRRSAGSCWCWRRPSSGRSARSSIAIRRWPWARSASTRIIMLIGGTGCCSPRHRGRRVATLALGAAAAWLALIFLGVFASAVDLHRVHVAA